MNPEKQINPPKPRTNLIWPITVIVASLIIGGAIYGVQLLKQRSIEHQADIDRQLNANIRAAEEAESSNRATALSACLIRAESNGMLFWNSECEAKGLEEDCLLPEYNASRVDQSIKDDKADCYKQYP